MSPGLSLMPYITLMMIVLKTNKWKRNQTQKEYIVIISIVIYVYIFALSQKIFSFDVP